MNGVTGRMGLNQHLRRSIYAIMQQGGVTLSDSEAIMPKPMLVGRNAAKLEAISTECGGLPWTTDLDEALADPDYSIYFDSQTTDRRADAVTQGHRRRQAHLLREAGRRQPGRRARTLPLRQEGRREARRGAGQALAARHAEAADPEGPRLLRPHLLRARRVRLLGLRRRHGAQPAPLLELPQGRRRRHHHRHAVPLALRARQPVRRREGRLLPGRHAHPDALGRSRQAVRLPPPTIPPTPPSSSKAASSRTSILLVRARAPRRSADHPGGRHEGHAPSPACATAGSSTTAPPRGPSGIPISTAR